LLEEHVSRGIQTPAQSKNLATAAKILAYTGARVNEIM
jgi:hypothetical protein